MHRLIRLALVQRWRINRSLICRNVFSFCRSISIVCFRRLLTGWRGGTRWISISTRTAALLSDKPIQRRSGAYRFSAAGSAELQGRASHIERNIQPKQVSYFDICRRCSLIFNDRHQDKLPQLKSQVPHLSSDSSIPAGIEAVHLCHPSARTESAQI